MNQFRKFMLPLALLALAACSSDPPNDRPDPEDPDTPQVTLRQAPEECDAGKQAEIIAKVTIENGSIALVTLHYNDGSNKSVAMTATANADEYSGKLTAPATVGGTIDYYVKAISNEDKSAQSDPVTLTSTEEKTEVVNPAKALRLSEIGTSGTYKFIEIYNPSGMIVPLEGVALWKNGELLNEFDSSKEIDAKAYGVYRAKGSSFTLPKGAADLGATETGLSGSKSLSIELRVDGKVVDAFANTVNPGIAQMTIDDWDGLPEIADGTNFIRPKGSTYGWYATPATTAATPGAVNGSTGTRLKHQLIKDDAVADKPYITNIIANPDDPTTGITPAKNVIMFSVYYDAHSVAPTVSSSLGSPSNTEGVVWQIAPSLTGSASGTSTAITLTATNGAGTLSEKINLLVYPNGTAFGTYTDIKLNEIMTSTKDGIELYNTSSKPVNISGMRIRKNKDRIFTVPGYMVIKGKGYAVIGCNGKDYTPISGQDYVYLGSAPNGLSGSKSLLIELRKPKVENDDTNSINIDSFVNTGVSSPNKDSAWDVEGSVENPITLGVGRSTDGTGSWYLETTTSMGASNTGSIRTGESFKKTYSQAGE